MIGKDYMTEVRGGQIRRAMQSFSLPQTKCILQVQVIHRCKPLHLCRKGRFVGMSSIFYQAR